MKRTKPQQMKVRCADCRHFQRDTEGLCYNVVTGVYFMGTCPLGHSEGTVKGRVFADANRVCGDFKSKGNE